MARAHAWRGSGCLTALLCNGLGWASSGEVLTPQGVPQWASGTAPVRCSPPLPACALPATNLAPHRLTVSGSVTLRLCRYPFLLLCSPGGL